MGRISFCRLIGLCTLSILALVRAGCGQALPPVAAQAAQLSAVTLDGHVPGWASPQNDLGAISEPFQVAHVTVFLARTAEKEKRFQQLLIDQQDAKSPLYHVWYTPQELGQIYGPDDDRIQAVTGWLRSAGMRVLNVGNSHAFIEASGDSVALSSALHVSFHRYQVGNEKRISIAENPAIPSRLSGIVTRISGLSTEKIIPAMRSADDGPVFTSCADSPCKFDISPNDFTAIYNASKVYQSGIIGTGHVIGIIGEAQVNSADITNFNTLTGASVPLPVLMPADTTVAAPFTESVSFSCDPNDYAGQCGNYYFQDEATLDVLRAGSVAHGAALQLIVSPYVDTSVVGDQGIFAATIYAVDTDPVVPDILNISFIDCESSSNSTRAQTWDGIFQQAAAEGLSVFVAAGDADATGCQGKSVPLNSQTAFLAINAICASSWVTCVGGTEFNPNFLPTFSSSSGCTPAPNWACTTSSDQQSASGYIPEGAWNDPYNSTAMSYVVSGTGGGFSQEILTPAWQASVNPTSYRAVPDLAFPASCNNSYFGCAAFKGYSCVKNPSTGQFFFASMCGTSAASPSMAGVMALVDQASGNRQGTANPNLYALGANPANGVFHDVTVASSGVQNCSLETASLCNNTAPSTTGPGAGLAGYMLQNGYDEVTGWGSVNIGNLIQNWAPSPSLSPNPATINIGAPGMSGSTTLTLYAFPSGPVSFTCMKVPLGVGCSFGQLSSNTVTMTISTTSAKVSSPSIGPEKVVAATFAMAMLLWLPSRSRRYRSLRIFPALMLLALGMMSIVGCASNPYYTSSGTTATVEVMAASGSASAVTVVMLTVQ
jgi:subtilase family serine protease